jgi:tRNA nucleotidyltransferase/poly(A) polymerase
MKVYEVGGCVRDRLMGRKPKDLDYVVVGATPEQMLELGYKQVGANFPVFIHPETGDEYALARTERKTGRGYYDFSFDANPDVTLEEDLGRRDLTINAMALDPDTGQIIDPYNGRNDLVDGILHHTTKAFAEDPVRVLRVARFASRYNFGVAHPTRKLMRELAESGELDTLTVERVFSEWDKAFREPFASRFLIELSACGAFEKLFPELTRYDLDVLQRAPMIPNAFSPAEITAMMLRSYNAHEEGIALLERIRAPTAYLTTLKKVAMLAFDIEGYLTKSSVGTLRLLNEIGAYRDPSQFYRAVQCVDFILTDQRERRLLYWIVEAFQLTRYLAFAQLSEEQRTTLRPKEIRAAIDEMRLNVIKQNVLE